MDIEFYIDGDTGEPHIAGHGVETWEAIDVLENPQVTYNGRGGTHVAIGQTRNGRYLRVIYRRFDAGRHRAFDLSANAKRALRRSRRRRP